MSLLELFCAVDDFWQAFAPEWHQKLLASGQMQRIRARDLSESEMMTIVIHFHQARYRDFKTYYTKYVQAYLRRAFPKLISYERFVQLLPSILDRSVCICKPASVTVAASPLSIPVPSPFVITDGFTVIKSLTDGPPAGRLRWAGSLV